MADYEKLKYDISEIPLAEAVRTVLGVPDLEGLEASDKVATREEDQKTRYHELFYKHYESAINPLYRKLVAALVGEERLEEVYIQRVPTFRVHLRNSVAVGTWHRDKDFGHDPSEVNYWVPMTRAFGNNTVWIENQNVDAEYGEVVVFDGANQLHGNVVNDTPISRVSMDFRILARADYRPNEKRSVSNDVPFLLGHYWDVP